MSDRYVFLKTTINHNNEVVALIGDIDVIGEAGIKSLQNAFNAKANPIIRTGVLTLNKAALKELRNHIEDSGGGMPNSLKQLDRAMDCIDAKRSYNALIMLAATDEGVAIARARGGIPGLK